MPSQIISFRLGDNDIQLLQSHAQGGESLNQTAQRLLKAAMGIPTSKLVEQMSTLSTEQLEKLDKLSNLPTRTEFHELKERVNDFRLSLLREIQNRDKGINLLAEQIADLTYRIDNMPAPGVDKEALEAAKSTVLQNWRTARSAEGGSASLSLEKKERIEQALDKFIDIVAPPPTPQPENVPEIAQQVPPKRAKARVAKEGIKKDLKLDLEIDEDDKIPKSAWKEWEQVCCDTITDLRELWREK